MQSFTFERNIQVLSWVNFLCFSWPHQNDGENKEIKLTDRTGKRYSVNRSNAL